MRERIGYETSAFIHCVASGADSTPTVTETVIEPCAVCFGDFGCEACRGTCEHRTTRVLQSLHPADTWTLRSIGSLSVNGSFT
ncbi:hypothetical protein WMF38_57775 [Sorangium sp. So ce118]